ncbi:MAG TPA: crosslink repair DNA glycosylase YcaQ family protein [Baekduia sp.]|nr:crosslink repair DNA glycosylase YcaQ family protein [Baekduia sp.]
MPASPSPAARPARGGRRRRERLSAAEARRVALAAQGFADPPLGREVDTRALRSRVLDRVGLVQIDSVNVLQRAHYLPAFSRLGAYDTGLLDKLSHYAPRRLFEYWGHEASLIPVELHPHLRWRMRRAHDDAWGGMRRVARERPELVRAVLEDLRERGPLPASALMHHDEPRGPKGPWWDWSDVKRALEFLFWSGEVTSARRRRFERLYDVPERVLPPAVLRAPTPSDDEAQRALLRVAARSLGIATESDLRDYFRLPAADAKPRVAELVEAGELLPVEVEGWRTPAYLAPGARVPRRVDARALVGPFDSLIWERPRVERIFGFRYRIEIYVPKPQRVHGYYVLPFLLGDRLVARVDLKSDRAAGALLVQAAHAEPDAPAETAVALASELRALASWLTLDDVVVAGAGDLASPVRAALAAR